MVCNGYVYGMMVSRLADRPCGIGFLDIVKYNKFLTCGVDDADDVYEENENYYNLDLTTAMRPHADLTTVIIPTKEEEVTESESPPSPQEEPEPEEPAGNENAQEEKTPSERKKDITW